MVRLLVVGNEVLLRKELTPPQLALLLAQAQAQVVRNGFFDQTAQLWNEAGVLLATSHQVVYYKE